MYSSLSEGTRYKFTQTNLNEADLNAGASATELGHRNIYLAVGKVACSKNTIAGRKKGQVTTTSHFVGIEYIIW